MNKTDSLSEKSCNSIFFEDEAKVLTFACITTENVKDFPLLLGEVGTNKVVAPENAEESKYLVVEGKKEKENIVNVENCISRLRVDLKDPKKVDQVKIKDSGCAGIFFPSEKHIHVVFGPHVEFVRHAVDDLLKK